MSHKIPRLDGTFQAISKSGFPRDAGKHSTETTCDCLRGEIRVKLSTAHLPKLVPCFTAVN